MFEWKMMGTNGETEREKEKETDISLYRKRNDQSIGEEWERRGFTQSEKERKKMRSEERDRK